MKKQEKEGKIEIASSSLKTLTSAIEWIAIPFLIFIILFGWICPPDELVNHSNSLTIDSTAQVSPQSKEVRLRSLTDIFLQAQANHIQQSAARDSDRAQSRLFFAAILGALIVASHNPLNSELRRVSAILILAFGSLVYFNDVRAVELGMRQAHEAAFIDNSVITLANVPYNDCPMYKLDTIRVSIFRKHQKEIRYMTLFQLAIRPEIDQSLFYLIPMLIIICIRRYQYWFEARRLTSRQAEGSSCTFPQRAEEH